MANKEMQVVIVEPHKKPEIATIDGSLEGMQKVVGGLIEPIYMEDDTALICNEEGKINGSELNRALFDEDGEIYDIVAGKFFVCLAPPDSENFESLPDDVAKKVCETFKEPQSFFRRRSGQIIVVPDEIEKPSLDSQIKSAEASRNSGNDREHNAPDKDNDKNR